MYPYFRNMLLFEFLEVLEKGSSLGRINNDCMALCLREAGQKIAVTSNQSFGHQIDRSVSHVNRSFGHSWILLFDSRHRRRTLIQGK